MTPFKVRKPTEHDVCVCKHTLQEHDAITLFCSRRCRCMNFMMPTTRNKGLKEGYEILGDN